MMTSSCPSPLTSPLIKCLHITSFNVVHFLGRIAVLQHVDAAHCYRLSSVVCRSICLSVTIVIDAKTAEPIETPLGMWTRVRPRNHVLHGVHIGAIWRKRLNRPCAAAIPPYVKLYFYRLLLL